MKNGKALDLRRLREARAEEMEFVQQLGVYKYAFRDEALKASGGKPPVRVRWVDTD